MLEGKIFKRTSQYNHNENPFRAFWGFHKHFPDLADNLFGSLDPATQRSVNKESDTGGIGSGGVSMSASLRGSNSSLNSMPGGVLSRFSWFLLC